MGPGIEDIPVAFDAPECHLRLHGNGALPFPESPAVSCGCIEGGAVHRVVLIGTEKALQVGQGQLQVELVIRIGCAEVAVHIGLTAIKAADGNVSLVTVNILVHQPLVHESQRQPEMQLLRFLINREMVGIGTDHPGRFDQAGAFVINAQPGPHPGTDTVLAGQGLDDGRTRDPAPVLAEAAGYDQCLLGRSHGGIRQVLVMKILGAQRVQLCRRF